MQIERLTKYEHWARVLAEAQFDYWGPLTGFDNPEEYVAGLQQWSVGEGIPVVLVAANGSELLGSVNLLRSDMKSRRQLMPWLAQLFVVPQHRRAWERHSSRQRLSTLGNADLRPSTCTLQERCHNTTRA